LPPGSPPLLDERRQDECRQLAPNSLISERLRSPAGAGDAQPCYIEYVVLLPN
jgi:hypothetical protein